MIRYLLPICHVFTRGSVATTMGKVRRNRRKFHASAAKDCGEEKIGIKSIEYELDAKAGTGTLVLPPLDQNPFHAVKISQSDLNQSLDLNNNEIGSIATIQKEPGDEPSGSEIRLNKKEKRKQRRDNFLKKLSMAKVEMESKKSARKRAKAPVVGDLRPLTLALPEIEKIMNRSTSISTTTKKKKKRKPRRLRGLEDKDKTESYYKSIDQTGMKKIQSKRTQKHMLFEIDRMKKLLSDPSFKKDAERTVNEMVISNIAKLKEP